MSADDRAALEARLAALRKRLDPQWEFIDGGHAYQAQRVIAAEIRELEKQLAQG